MNILEMKLIFGKIAGCYACKFNKNEFFDNYFSRN